jgi:hypothetical protein
MFLEDCNVLALSPYLDGADRERAVAEARSMCDIRWSGSRHLPRCPDMRAQVEVSSGTRTTRVQMAGTVFDRCAGSDPGGREGNPRDRGQRSGGLGRRLLLRPGMASGATAATAPPAERL